MYIYIVQVSRMLRSNSATGDNVHGL